MINTLHSIYAYTLQVHETIFLHKAMAELQLCALGHWTTDYRVKDLASDIVTVYKQCSTWLQRAQYFFNAT